MLATLEVMVAIRQEFEVATVHEFVEGCCVRCGHCQPDNYQAIEGECHGEVKPS